LWRNILQKQARPFHFRQQKNPSDVQGARGRRHPDGLRNKKTMRTLKNESGFIQWIPLAICCLFALYIIGALAWSKVETYLWHRQARMEERAAAEAKIEEKRIAKDQALAEKQMEAIQVAYADQADMNRRLIEEQAKTADRIAAAHERAAGEILKTNEKAVSMLMNWAKEGPQATDKGILYILGAVALAAVGGLVFVVIALIRRGGGRYPDGPVIFTINGEATPGRIASGADVYRLIEHRKETAR